LPPSAKIKPSYRGESDKAGLMRAQPASVAYNNYSPHKRENALAINFFMID
jgi:hypothetical protein